MKILRWIFGFPLATAIAFGLLYVTITSETLLLGNIALARGVRLLASAVIIVLTLAIWVFLTCWFIPVYKWVAGMAPILIMIVFLIWETYSIFYSSISRGLSTGITYTYSGALIGMALGYSCAYIIFKNKGWGSLKKVSEPNLVQLYDEQLQAEGHHITNIDADKANDMG